MLEINTVPYQPHPNLSIQTGPGPTIAAWKEHKSHRSRAYEVFGDIQIFPFVGERQAGRAANLYTMTARGVDQELRALPYSQRLVQPQSGTWPIVVGSELGPGPNPWDQRSNRVYRKQTGLHVGDRGPIAPTLPTGTLTGVKPVKNVASWAQGPHASRGPVQAPEYQVRKERTLGDRFTAIAKGQGDTALKNGGSLLGGLAGYYVTGTPGGAYSGAKLGRSATNRFNPWKGREYDRRANH